VLVAQWQPTTGIQTYTTNSLIFHGGNLFVTAYGRGVYWSTDEGSSWYLRSTGLTDSNVTALTSDGTILYVGTDTKGVLRTTDTGAHWVPANAGMGNIRIMSLCSHHGVIFAGAYFGGLFRSTDRGSSWQLANGGLPYSDFRSLASSDSGVFAGTYPGDVIRSTDDGMTWKSLSVPASDWVTSILLVGSTILASTDGTPNVFRSTNMGTTWIDSDSGMSTPGVYAFAMTGQLIFAGTYWGFYMSSNGGASWLDASSGLPDLTIYALAINSTHIFAGGYAKGVWRRPLSEMIASVNEADRTLPTQFSLAQNYPNPFNPSTTIHIELPRESHVHLELFNVLGESVMQLLNEKRQAGVYDVPIKAGGLSSGVYFYRLTAGDFVQTKKMILMK